MQGSGAMHLNHNQLRALEQMYTDTKKKCLEKGIFLLLSPKSLFSPVSIGRDSVGKR